MSIRGFATNRNKKSHPIHGKKGVDEKSFSVTEKGTNNKIEVKPAFVSNGKPEPIHESIKENYRLTKPQKIMMTPKQYLEATDDDSNWIPDHGLKSVNNLKKRMEENKPIDEPYLVYDGEDRFDNDPNAKPKPRIIDQEGRHRAYTARMLGIQKIPVNVYCVKHGIFGCQRCKKITISRILNASSTFPNQREEEKIARREFNQYFKDVEKNHEMQERIAAIFK